MKTRMFIIVFFLLVLFGCHPVKPTLISREEGNVEIVFSNLVEECIGLVADGKMAGKETWMKGEKLPATIAALSPQYVQILVTEDVTLVDIQTSGGFRHSGYLVVCYSKIMNFEPKKGRKWTVLKVKPNVFKYSE